MGIISLNPCFKHRYIDVGVCACVHTYFCFCLLRGPISNDTQIAVNTPITQVFISKDHFPLKRTKTDQPKNL